MMNTHLWTSKTGDRSSRKQRCPCLINYLAITVLTLLCVLSPPATAQPVITTQPADTTVNQGFRATFRVSAPETESLNYRWHFNSYPIPGATTNTLTISPATAETAGDYFVVISDSMDTVTSRVARLTVMPPVRLEAKVQTNLWLGTEPTTLPTNRLAQVEPHIARSFGNPNLLAAAWMEGKHSSGGGAMALGAAVSRDGGNSWQRSLVPNLTTNTGGGFERVADPVIGVGADDTIYLATIGFGTQGTANSGSILVSRLSNDGSDFAPPVAVRETASTSFYLDKPWLSVNDFTNSPTANRLAVAWIEVGVDASGNDTSATTYFSVSDDKAATWSPRALIANGTVAPAPLFLPDGSMAVFYQPYPGFTSIDMAISERGGTNFDRRSRVASYSPYWDSNARQSGSAAVATDRVSGVLYVSFQANHSTGPRIMFTRSIDKGRTWSNPIPVNDTPNKRSVFNPAIAVSPDGLHVLIAFCDKRHDTGAGYLVDLYMAESFDGGLSWQPNTRLTDFSSDLRKAPQINSNYMLGDYHGIVPPLDFESPAWVAYCDTRSGNADPVLIAIREFGSPAVGPLTLRRGPDLGVFSSDGEDYPPRDVTMLGGHAFVSGTAYLTVEGQTKEKARLHVVDVRNSQRIERLAMFEDEGSGGVLQVSGNHIFWARRDVTVSKLDILDGSDPMNLRRVSSLEIQGYVRDLCVDGDNAYLVSDNLSAKDSVLQVVNYRNPTQPVVQGMIKVPFAGNLGVSSGYVFFTIGAAGPGEVPAVQVLDARNPSDIVPISVYRLDPGLGYICVAGGLAYVAGKTTNELPRLDILDVRNPTRPSLVGTWTSEPGTLPYIQSLQVSEGIVVLGMSRLISGGGPWILDCRNPAQIKLIDRRGGLRGEWNGIHLVGSRLLFVGMSGLSTYRLAHGLWLEITGPGPMNNNTGQLTWKNEPGVRLLSSPNLSGAAWEEIATFPDSGRVGFPVIDPGQTVFFRLVKP